MAIVTVGIDLAKNVFAVHGVDESGKPVLDAKKTWTIDPAAEFHKGPAFKDYFELRDHIAARTEDFGRGFSEALVEYGLGRPIGFGDEPLIDAMVAEAKRGGFGVRVFIQALVASGEFRSK